MADLQTVYGVSNLSIASGKTFTVSNTLTLQGTDSSTIDVGSGITIANSFTTSGNFALTLTTTGATNVTLPTSGIIAKNSSDRYTKGNISGAVSIDYDNGDYQVCTTTATVTGITISDLTTETGMILRINNSGGYAVTFGSTEIIATTDTGDYLCAFYNDNGTIYFTGKGEAQN